MRRYADPVEVRRGPVDPGPTDRRLDGGEGPQQFLWRGRLWKVRAVLAHWVETEPWWQSTAARATIGTEEAVDPAQDEPQDEPRDGSRRAPDRRAVPIADLLGERELWRVEAGRGAWTAAGEADGGGVFDLSFDWADGRWTLVGCAD